VFKLKAEHFIVAPTFLESLRIQQGTLGAYQEGGISGLSDWVKQDVENQLYLAGTMASLVYFPGRITQLRYLPALIRGGLSPGKSLRIYGSNLLPFPSLGTLALGALLKHLQSRGGRDAKPGLPPVAPGRRPRPINPSKPTRSGSTSKPFWANGKPKCKKGFRYDFKRKLCVKIK
jgi:hypothetical protein